MILTSFFTDEVAADIGESLLAGRQAGAQSVELRSAIYGKRIDQLTEEELLNLSRLLVGNDLTVACIASSFGKCELDSDEEWRTHQEILRGSVRAAQMLHTSIIRVFPFWTPGKRELPRPGIEDYLDRIVACMKWAVRLAEDAGVVLCFETEASTHSGTCREARLIVDALGPSQALGVTWDMNNAWYAGHEHPLQEGYPWIRGLVRHLHVKPNKKGTIETIGDSSTSYVEVLRVLIGDGFTGAASIEHWGSPDMMLTGICQLRRVLDRLQ